MDDLEKRIVDLEKENAEIKRKLDILGLRIVINTADSTMNAKRKEQFTRLFRSSLALNIMSCILVIMGLINWVSAK